MLQCCGSDGDLRWKRVNTQKSFADVASTMTIVIFFQLNKAKIYR